MCIETIILGILGGQEIILIGIIALILFGGKKIPELMRGLGKGVAEFKKAKNEVESEISGVHSNPEPTPENKSVTPPQEAPSVSKQ